MATKVTVLYDDENGTDLLVDDRHNVNLGWEREALSVVTHTSRDGKPMEVQFNPVFRSYFIMVGDNRAQF